MALLAGLASGCSELPPFDVAGGRIIVLCMVNCPVTMNLADEGHVTDALEQTYPHVDPRVVAAAQPSLTTLAR